MDSQYNYISPEEYEIAEQNGIKQKTLEARVREYGWEIERAITEQPKKYKPFKPIWDKWRTIAQENGIGRDLFYNRVRERGIPEVEAATMPAGRGGRPRSRWTDGELELMDRNGLNQNLVNTRINTLGWDRHEALNTPKLTDAERAKRVAEGTRRYYKERGVNREFNKTI